MFSVGVMSSPHLPIDSGGKAKSDNPVTAVVLSPQSLSWKKNDVYHNDSTIFGNILALFGKRPKNISGNTVFQQELSWHVF